MKEISENTVKLKMKRINMFKYVSRADMYYEKSVMNYYYFFISKLGIIDII